MNVILYSVYITMNMESILENWANFILIFLKTSKMLLIRLLPQALKIVAANNRNLNVADKLF